MPELRKDPIIGRWVIISTERGKRPSDFDTQPMEKRGGFCPFCPGNEEHTPPEILAYRPENTAPNSSGWTLRVFSNKYPALRIEGNLNRAGVGIFDKMDGIGAHEVIVESPDHEKNLVDLTEKQVEDVIWAYRHRALDLKKDPRFKYILIFKNHGEAAGASLEHSHSQLTATPIVPKRVMEELEGAGMYYGYKERCVFCDIIRQECQEQIRVVCQNDQFVALEPFASRFPFETWILPKEHQAAFEKIGKKEVVKLAQILKETLMKLGKSLNYPPYNYIIHNAPYQDMHDDDYHWHIEIMPKLTKVAGFEWGTGFYINPTPPEDAARCLREMEV